MITMNGFMFSETPAEHTSECIGTAKRLKREVRFFDNDNRLIGIINCWGVFARATALPVSPGNKQEYWYQAAAPECVGGLEYDCAQLHDDVHSLTKGSDNGKYRFI